ncbi:ACR3 family arsenite efflux transporter [Alphaproteobacteria bacterium]|nr:ACR3 family arsenite efflux transporter [Alphaproteobacteria bacterium]
MSESPLGLFGKYLSVWVSLCIIVGIALGNIFPFIFLSIANIQYQNVNFIVAILIWLMIYPMMVQIDFSSLKNIGNKRKGFCITLIINWLVKPFTMAALGVLFFKYIYSGWIPETEGKEYIAGLILLGIAPCTAMVFVWSQLTKGDPNYTLIQVSLNDIIMIFAFAPLAAILLGLTNILVPWETLILSIILYVVIPLAMGMITRKIFIKLNNNLLEKFNKKIQPYSILGLLLTVLLLFGFQAETIITKPIIILLIAIPLIIQSYGIFIIAYVWSYLWKIPHKIAAPVALIGTSNFFELAVAVAISLFGVNSGAALATVVGVLVEVPVMLSLVKIINNTKHRFNS